MAVHAGRRLIILIRLDNGESMMLTSPISLLDPSQSRGLTIPGNGYVFHIECMRRCELNGAYVEQRRQNIYE